MSINIAIDGPSAAGKSTIAKELAKRLNYVHLDSGAMYRCAAYSAQLNDINVKNENEIVKMLEKTEIALTSDGKIYLNNEEVNNQIRTQAISMLASDISAFEKVREELVSRQQKMALKKGVIMDGRDIGTVVLPEAEVKIFLTASPEARAERRYKENCEKGFDCDLETITKEIIARDLQDTTRVHSPLKKAEDAIEIDSSNLTVEEVVQQIIKLIK